jgi:hypothetical protein
MFDPVIYYRLLRKLNVGRDTVQSIFCCENCCLATKYKSFATICCKPATIGVKGVARRGTESPLGGIAMKKFLILAASVSALALAGCNKAEEKKVEAPAAPAAEPAAPAAAPAAEPAPAAPAAEPAPAAPAAEPAAPATDAMAPAMIDPTIQASIDQMKAAAATMTAEQKTAAVAQVRSAAEAAAKASGGDDAAAKTAGDAAEAAAKSALGM